MIFFGNTLSKFKYISLKFTSLRNISTELKNILSEKILIEREKIKEFRKSHGSVAVSTVYIDSIYRGMRGVKTLICETSVLDPDKGIRFRGYSISECQEMLPKAKGGKEPLPEGIFWLLLTGEVPTEAQVTALSQEWAKRAEIPTHVDIMIRNFPENLHPMSKFSAAITALNTESEFVKAYKKGVKKIQYWEYVYEDVMNLIAKLPIIAAKIYKTHNKRDQGSGVIDPSKDWGANLAHMMGFDDPLFMDMMRLYLTIHSDHGGGNVSSHTVHLVGSALSDPYLAFAAGMMGLAGPLHGLANQEVVMFIKKIQKELGEEPEDSQLSEYIRKTLKEGQLIPGFGHTVLRVKDPRYTCQRKFALMHFPHDPLFSVVEQLFDVVPDILQETGKIKNPWPNVCTQSGVLLHYFGLTDVQIYTVLFGVSRSLGTLSSLIWDRGLGFPIERPKSFSTDLLEKLVNQV